MSGGCCDSTKAVSEAKVDFGAGVILGGRSSLGGKPVGVDFGDSGVLWFSRGSLGGQK